MPKLNAAYLKRLMDDKGLTQAIIAKKLEIDPSTVSNWFKGLKNPTTDKIEKLAQILDTEKDSLIDGDEASGAKASQNFNPDMTFTPTYNPTNITVHSVEIQALYLIVPDGNQNLSEILANLTKPSAPSSPSNN